MPDESLVHREALARDPDAVRRLNETLERCRVISQERTDFVRTRERVGWMGPALNPLLSTRRPGPSVEGEMGALIALALAGWSWRAAEVGDVARVSDDIHRAHRLMENDESVPRGYVTTWTAWKFLADGGEPGLGSPGDTDGERVAFLDAAFQKFYETYGIPTGIETERARAAFRHGVVLCDVERIVNQLEIPL